MRVCSLLSTVPDPVLINVALNKTSFQISTFVDRFGEHSAGLANDGSRQTDFSVRENGCAASNPANYPWWAVDLDVPTLVYQINFTNRGDTAGNWLTLSCLFLFYLQYPYTYHAIFFSNLIECFIDYLFRFLFFFF